MNNLEKGFVVNETAHIVPFRPLVLPFSPGHICNFSHMAHMQISILLPLPYINQKLGYVQTEESTPNMFPSHIL